MAISIVRLGSPRTRGEGLRLGTVRRPPRGVPKSEFAKRDDYDVWLPDLSPTQDLVSIALRTQEEARKDEGKEKAGRDWKTFERKFRAEMRQPEPSRLLDLLAALSHQTSFAVGCYCEQEEHCHRSVLRKLLEERGARITK